MQNARPRVPRRRTVLFAVCAAIVSTAGLGGCGDSAGTGTPAPTPSPTAATALVVRDPWVKAGRAGEMTAAFGVLVNDTDADVTVVSVDSPASPMELHEMAMDDGQMVMRPKDGGFVVEAGSTHELGPGGDHLMLMKPVAAIEPGDELEFTLNLSDRTTVRFTAIAKPFAGAAESYAPGMPMGSAAP